ncbi:MAG: S8 family peptidase [Clostridium sp.]|uniref:S8 family peptidase n=1 Tax=Clostridium sp. TaxID=1506 RepID=UPI003029F74B
MEKSEGLLDFLINIPNDIRQKVIGSYSYEDILSNKVELVVLYGGDAATLKRSIEAIGGTFDDLGYGFGIITINGSLIPQLSSVRQINFIELPKNLFLTFEPSNRASCITEVNSNYSLYGEGVLIGFIDSGIDYRNLAFREENGDTRIDFIYDLDKGGIVYTKEQINEALKNPDPYSVVDHEDRVGHGTHVAGIACAGGRIPRINYGVAPKSSIAMVKMTREAGGVSGKSTQLMRGIKFLVDKSYEVNKPLVINISFSTNDGAHNGGSLLERYINAISTVQRVTIVIAAGNEGNTAHHIGGQLKESQSIQLNIGKEERVIIINLYKSFLKDITLTIVSPNGSSSGPMRLTRSINSGKLGGSQYFVYYSGPTPFDIDGETIIVLSGVGDNPISNGIWTMNMVTSTRYIGGYDMWLPIAEGLNTVTRFLSPTVNNTVGIPGTVASVITVGSYNYINSNISSFSGRGNATLSPVKPEIVAPGEKIYSSTQTGGFNPKSGTSMSTPQVAGASGLLMEFGIVNGKDPYLYGDRLKYFLLKGARRNRVDVEYPNNSWGYGALCLANAINIWNDEVQ